MSTIATGPAPAEAAPLDEVMLAMDVVDTLRHNQDLVARELAGDAREKQLIDKLRDIYHQQGIEVTDEVLREGVKALAESRFVYTPPKAGLATGLARLYVSRRRWGPAMLALLLVLGIGLGGYFLAWRPYQEAQAAAARIELSETLPAQMDALYQSIFEDTKVQAAVVQADALRAHGRTATAEGNREGALKAIADLTALRDRLRQEYTLRIVNREGQKTGFWTFPEINTDATNYYIVVEALGTDNRPLTLPITNEENGKTENVAIWGVRVPESIYKAVENDKRDNGIVDNSVIGVKQYGFLEVNWAMPVMGGAVTRW